MQIEKDLRYGEANIAVIGITKLYGKPQVILVNSDKGDTEGLKFVGSRFRAPSSSTETLDDVAKSRFEEQTGLKVDKMLGLRAVVPSRNRHGNWNFRNVFLALTDGKVSKENDGRRVYVSDPEQLSLLRETRQASLYELGNSRARINARWVSPENIAISDIARRIIHNFDWERKDTSTYRRIHCLGVEPQTKSDDRKLGCALAVASSAILYKPSTQEPLKIIMLKRKGDAHPGYVGGKIQTPESGDLNLDPISCCMEEGTQELGFPITARALIGVAHTTTDMPNEESFYSGILTYSFIAEPLNSNQVRAALKDPKRYLEGKMECYVVEDLLEHRDRIGKGYMRMPDNIPIGEELFKLMSSPGQAIPLTQIVSSGMI